MTTISRTLSRLTTHLRFIRPMSTSPSTSTVPEWKTLLDKSLSENPGSLIYSIATLDSDGQPRVRSVVHRDFISPTPSQPLLVSTTDVRMPKVGQITSPPHRVEVAWWIAPSGSQFRLSGRAYILPPPAHPLHSLFPFSRFPSIDWDQKRLETYSAVGGHIRAGFAGPAPGSKLGSYDDMKRYPQTLPELGKEEGEKEKEWNREAVGRFCLMVVEVESVDMVELRRDGNRRTVWVLQEDGEWKKGIVAP